MAERLARWTISVLFLVSGLSYIENPFRSIDVVYSHQMVGRGGGALIATLLPFLELQVAYCFCCNVQRLTAWIWSVAVFAAVAFAEGWVLVRGADATSWWCGATGAMEVGMESILVSVTLLLFSATCCGFTLWERLQPGTVDRGA